MQNGRNGGTPEAGDVQEELPLNPAKPTLIGHRVDYRNAPKAAIPRDEIGPPGSTKSRLQERERLPFTAPASRTTRKVDFPINNASART
jgi:hypothetical protein